MRKKKTILVIIPAYNEEKMIGKVLSHLPKEIKGIGKIEVLVIDDGSYDKTAQVAYRFGAIVLRHIINRGLGASLATGFSYAKKSGAEIAVTFDADGQHRGIDIPRLVKPIIQKKADVVIGSRLKGKSTMPFLRKMVNLLSNIATLILFGIWTTDSQSGFRAFSKRAIDRMKLRTQRMEVSSEIFKEIKHNQLSMVEIPIPAIYTAYSLRKGQKLSNASNVIWKLILRNIS